MIARLIRYWSCAKCGSRNSDNSLVCMACIAGSSR